MRLECIDDFVTQHKNHTYTRAIEQSVFFSDQEIGDKTIYFRKNWTTLQ
jgi:hypothetical protein